MSELKCSKEKAPEHLDASFWNNLWQKKDTGWDLKAVSPPLKAYFDAMTCKNKSILIPGCGNAYEAEYLLQNGFKNITVIDISPVLVKQLLEKFATYVGKELTVICGDFFKHTGSYDFIIEQTFLSALEKNRREDYASKMHSLLKQDAKLAGVIFNKEFENSPPFGGSKQEYLNLFSAHFSIEKMEECMQSATPRLDAELFIELKRNKMKIEQIYTGCLAQGAYYIESDGEAAIIDPLREVQPYIEKAAKDNAKIKYVFETHFHADFVSGHIDLAKKTGATIVFGPNAETDFAAHIATDGELFSIGKIKIKVLHTPGHTMESSCFLLIDEYNKEHCLFTGDTLFIGDVGRPDLAIKSNVTKEDLAGYLYDSLHNKIMTLQDDLIIYPAHGAGSACGKNMSKETVSTLGNQRKFNYALQSKTKEQFIKEVTDGLAPPPQYFPKNAMMNKHGYESIDAVYEKGLNGFNADDFEQAANEFDALVLDTRNEIEFAKAHIPNSIFIGLDGNFAPWVGALITDLKQPILLVCEKGKEQDAITRLSRVGYDNTIGYLENGFETWTNAGKETDSIEAVTAQEVEKLYTEKKLHILDVRKPSEFEAAHIENADNQPLDYINNWINTLFKNESYYVHCAGGYRSVITISILKSRGFHDLYNIDGGFKSFETTKIPTIVNSAVASCSL